MKKTYRRQDNAEYWDDRWRRTPADQDGFSDMNIYPIRFAELVMDDPEQQVLEIGCGLGRVISHYHRRGYNIAGIERSAIAVEKLRQAHVDLKILKADVLALPFADQSFDLILAFGVYHNLETGLATALAETSRCLRPGGRFCLSMRPDNLEMRVNELYWLWRNRHLRHQPRHFHKLLTTPDEFTAMLAEAGLIVESVHYSRNLPSLYRIPLLRDRSQGSESERRASGYRLNAAGRLLDSVVTRLFPFQTANVMVFTGRRSHAIS